jgi:predicted small lipoprotein YifL
MRHPFKCRPALAVLLATLALAACGTRGPLTLPPPAKPAPAGADAPAPAAAADLNTAKDPAR